MKTVLTILLIITLFNLSILKEENEFENLLNIRWILNDKHNSGSYYELNELNFVNSNSEIVESLPYHIKFAGLTFKKNNEFIEHVWNKCRTGNPPSHYNGKWKFDKENKIIMINNTQKWNGKYLVLKMNLKELKLKRIK